MFTVTKQWLDAHKTKSGGYTRLQLQLLGFVGWPPPKGWKPVAVGHRISLVNKTLFEQEAEKSKAKPLQKCLQLIKKLNNDDLRVLSEACRASITCREGKK